MKKWRKELLNDLRNQIIGNAEVTPEQAKEAFLAIIDALTRSRSRDYHCTRPDICHYTENPCFLCVETKR